MMELVEREPALQTLRLRLQSTSLCGHIVLVAGEAGVGKTSMLRALAATHGTVWWGACDALQTPHPLAPLLARDAQNPQPPVLFNHPFHLVRSPNRYGVPAFYELHLWVWEHNRDGIFNDWNPAVHCH